MRITVNLSIFFHDHRCLAKIFINKHMKSVKDVEKHITEIFKINNFYLKCENQYLPSVENVKVLNNDDIVWVIPKEEAVANGDVVHQEQQVEEQNKDNKQFELNNADTEEMEIEEVPEKRKKKKKKKQDTDFDDININLKKHKSKISDSDYSYKICRKDSGRDSLETTKSEEKTPESTITKVQTLVNSFESKSKLLKDCENRKINIVKTIIASNNKSQNEKSETPVNGLKEPTDCIDLESSSSVNCSTSNEPFFITKRKRKRPRNRKRSQKTEQNNTSTEKPIYNFIHKPLIVQTPTHLRFEEKKNVETTVINELNNEETKTYQKNEIATIVQENTVEATEKVCENLETYSDQQIEDCISKQPITKNAEPRVSDVIAFKILRISENYTPEVSSTIVGKVIEYNLSEKEITFDIVYGKDQCSLPQGKFSLESTEPSEEHFRCSWTSLIEPRLLYP